MFLSFPFMFLSPLSLRKKTCSKLPSTGCYIKFALCHEMYSLNCFSVFLTKVKKTLPHYFFLIQNHAISLISGHFSSFLLTHIQRLHHGSPVFEDFDSCPFIFCIFAETCCKNNATTLLWGQMKKKKTVGIVFYRASMTITGKEWWIKGFSTILHGYAQTF